MPAKKAPETSPAKKAAKKVAKKAAKKAAKKHAGHHDAKDLRRAFEHLGRIQTLERAVKREDAAGLAALASLAQDELRGGYAKGAADLLRAAEHLGFAALAAEGRARVAPELEEAIGEHFEKLVGKAGERWGKDDSRASAVEAMYQESLARAHTAFKAGEWCRALEFARAAEALAHTEQHGGRLGGGTKSRALAE